MVIKNSTILITGGTNGIGLEFVKQLLRQGANLIVTVRDMIKLSRTKQQFPQIHTFQNDVSNPKDIEQLCAAVTQQFPELYIIINNAGIMQMASLQNTSINTENIAHEIDTNFSGTVRMTHQFLPHLFAGTKVTTKEYASKSI
ncbi:SDR family NAD(P)-dependent oxidoreductase [Chitinophaga sp.]|uniref:SDR family NAD(P)-dependent oxidoreductase n=1 Tax=Chitinophaga sp. TaxID=1869181 RepID=UPI0031D1CCFE